MAPPGGKRGYRPPKANANTFRTQEEFLASLKPVPIDSLDPNSRRCAHCWKRYGESDPGHDNAEEPVKFRCSHVFGEKCMRDLFGLPKRVKIDLVPLAFDPDSNGADLGRRLSEYLAASGVEKEAIVSDSDKEAVFSELLKDIEHLNNARRGAEKLGNFWFPLIQSACTPRTNVQHIHFLENALIFDTATTPTPPPTTTTCPHATGPLSLFSVGDMFSDLQQDVPWPEIPTGSPPLPSVSQAAPQATTAGTQTAPAGAALSVSDDTSSSSSTSSPNAADAPIEAASSPEPSSGSISKAPSEPGSSNASSPNNATPASADVEPAPEQHKAQPPLATVGVAASDLPPMQDVASPPILPALSSSNTPPQGFGGGWGAPSAEAIPNGGVPTHPVTILPSGGGGYPITTYTFASGGPGKEQGSKPQKPLSDAEKAAKAEKEKADAAKVAAYHDMQQKHAARVQAEREARRKEQRAILSRSLFEVYARYEDLRTAAAIAAGQPPVKKVKLASSSPEASGNDTTLLPVFAPPGTLYNNVLHVATVVHDSDVGAKHCEVAQPRMNVYPNMFDDETASTDSDPAEGPDVSGKFIFLTRTNCWKQCKRGCLTMPPYISVPEYVTWKHSTSVPDGCPVCSSVLFNKDTNVPRREDDYAN